MAEALKSTVDQKEPRCSAISDVEAYKIKLLETIVAELQKLNSK